MPLCLLLSGALHTCLLPLVSPQVEGPQSSVRRAGETQNLQGEELSFLLQVLHLEPAGSLGLAVGS